MALVWKDRVKETSTTTGTGTYTLAGAVAGHQGFSAIGDGNTCYYCATDGTNWEVGLGTYTSAGTTLARTSVIASSNSGSAVNWSAGTRTVFVTAPAAWVNPPPRANGFRLTLATGDPVTTSDQSAKTTVYLTPYLSNQIALYDGSIWTIKESAEVPLALGTLTSDKNYDVFAYLSSGTLTLEAVAWTNDTTRATALVRQDGTWVKSGTTTRRYVGTFRTTSTTTTEDSAAKRFVFNADNQVLRELSYTFNTGSSHTYSTSAWRAWNNDAANRAQFVAGLPITIAATMNVGMRTDTDNQSPLAATDLDTTSPAPSGNTDIVMSVSLASTAWGYQASTASYAVAAGYHYILICQCGAGTGTQEFFVAFFRGWLLC